MAFRAALTGRQGPAFLEIPTDVLFRKVEEETAPMPHPRPTARRVAIPRPQGARPGDRRPAQG